MPLTDEEKKRKKIRKILGYIGFFIINALVIAVLLIVEDKSGDTASGKEAFARLLGNWYYAILAFAMFFIIVTFDTIVFSLLIKKTGTKVKRSGLAIKVAYLGRYYDRITPWAIGGEPFQMAYLTRGGLKTGQSCAVTMSRHIIRFFTTAVLVIAILIASRIATSIWVMVVAIFSVLIGLIIPSFMLICAFRPRLGERIARFCLDVLYKLHIVKNYEKNWSKLQETVDHFLQGIKYLSSNKQVIILIAIGAIIELSATSSLPTGGLSSCVSSSPTHPVLRLRPGARGLRNSPFTPFSRRLSRTDTSFGRCLPGVLPYSTCPSSWALLSTFSTRWELL